MQGVGPSSAQRALDDVAADPALAETRAALRLGGFAHVDYERILEVERRAVALGYPVLQ